MALAHCVCVYCFYLKKLVVVMNKFVIQISKVPRPKEEKLCANNRQQIQAKTVIFANSGAIAKKKRHNF